MMIHDEIRNMYTPSIVVEYIYIYIYILYKMYKTFNHQKCSKMYILDVLMYGNSIEINAITVHEHDDTSYMLVTMEAHDLPW